MSGRKKKVVVVGAGPAGMMAAISAASSQAEVCLLERNRSVGVKLLLTGGGRCNLTNRCKASELIERFSTNGKFLRDAFNAFNNDSLIEFFEKRGLKLKTEEGERVFPASDKADEVLKTLMREMEKCKVKILYNSTVSRLYVPKDKIEGVCLLDGEKVLGDKVILATGGLSYPETGSTGTGLKAAKHAGHTISPTRPGLVWLDMFEDFTALLEGITLDEVKVSFFADREKIVSGQGGIVFTSGGISGPLVHSLSGKVAYAVSKGQNVIVEIDFCPGETIRDAHECFTSKIERSPAKTVKNVLGELLPERLVDTILSVADVNGGKKANQVNAAERRKIIEHVKRFKMLVHRPGPIEKAMITCGGVSVKDIDPRTMASRKVKGLYFAGEMIDVDAATGGFNLQAAFSTGYLAGASAAAN